MGLSRYLLLSLLALGAWAKKDQPTIKEVEFENPPVGLHYFEDSDVVLISEFKDYITYRSENAGAKWERIEGPDKGEVREVLMHPYNNQVALVMGKEKRHWITKNQGKDWHKFESEAKITLARLAVNFHATDPDRMILLTQKCKTLFENCEDHAYYTTDGFKTKPKLLHEDASTCLWAKSTDLFTTGDDELDKNQILCITKPDSRSRTSEFELRVSDDFFKDKKGVEPSMGTAGTVSGMINVAAVKSYMVAVAKSENTNELAMFVSANAKTWHRAEFGEHKLEQDAFTLLESTNYSMQVDVLTTKGAPTGVFLTSNSNGTFFRTNIEHTNRNKDGFVDFEKMQNIQGIVMVNVVDNWEEVDRKWLAEKKRKTKISFEDGRPGSWKSLKADKKDLHLHSVSEQHNLGRIFSSPAPGIVMGVGNTGDYLKPWSECDTWVSDDAGMTWTKALDEPHFYEFGDQGAILVAIEDADAVDEIKWSIDHGKKWNKAKLEKLGVEGKIKPLTLTTTPDSTSLKFIMTAAKGKGSKMKHFTMAIDFEDLHERQCKDSDFEDWPARVDDDGKPSCIMGHTQTFRRRKADADCFVNKEFKDPVPKTKNCDCVASDYECDHANGFEWDSEKEECKLTGTIRIPDGKCKKGEDKYKGTSGYTLIPGNTCKGGKELDKSVERDCKNDKDSKGGKGSKGSKPSGKIGVEITKGFKNAEKFDEYYYLERATTQKGDDETIIMRTDDRKVYISDDHGESWDIVKTEDEVVAIYPHQYLNGQVYLVTPSKTVYWSHDRGKKWDTFEAPMSPNQHGLQILQFHPTEKNWLIWTGSKGRNDNSRAEAFVSQKGGDNWETLLRDIKKCMFAYRENRPESDELIFCEQYDSDDAQSPLNLVSSTDAFKHTKELKNNVVQFASMAEYIVVAIRDEDKKSLKVDASIDGKTFADAKFPHNFQVSHQQAYTVLDSATHAVFLHVTVNGHRDQEYGSILKSNSNGTSYVLSVNEVNRNFAGYVDFEKMQGLEGVAIINRVDNVKEVDAGKSKKIKTWITHNDGADWTLVPKPDESLKGKDFECTTQKIEDCSLHLHGYTERKDYRDTFSSPSAVGLMIANGNVGKYIGAKKTADTFATRDGGATWRVIAEGNWMWEYGDSGSIVVIVQEDEPTKIIKYSLDEGATWKEYEFSDVDMQVTDLTTVPSDTSRKFILWGKIKGDLATVSLDFEGLEERSEKCKFDVKTVGTSDSDFEWWTPKHPITGDDCLFGHVSKYPRKKLDRKCFIGRNEDITKEQGEENNCECTRKDYECDFNYERQNDGSCKLVDGLPKPDPAAMCLKDKTLVEYYDVTGYRRIPLTTCKGGQELELTSGTHPCKGHEEEYQKKHSISGAGLFFAIVIPIAAAAAVGYWVFKNWDGKFGRIRLGGDGYSGGGAGYSALDGDAPWVKFPVMALSAIAALVMALPMVAGSLWSAVTSRFGGGSRGAYAQPFTSRSSFQRGRGDYSVVDADEGELFGDESEDEA